MASDAFLFHEAENVLWSAGKPVQKPSSPFLLNHAGHAECRLALLDCNKKEN